LFNNSKISIGLGVFLFLAFEFSHRNFVSQKIRGINESANKLSEGQTRNYFVDFDYWDYGEQFMEKLPKTIYTGLQNRFSTYSGKAFF
jgi:hypothetical protein